MTVSFKLYQGVNNIRTGEGDYLWIPEVINPSHSPVVLLHGAGAPDPFNYSANWATGTLPAVLASHGIPCVAGWMGGDSFANDIAMSAIDSSIAYLKDRIPGITSSKVHLWGASMGNGLSLRYAGLNPHKVASIFGIIPLSDMLVVYETNRGSFRNSIGTAWGVTYPTPLPAQADLMGLHAPVIKANSIPCRFHYSTIDTLIPPSEVIALAAATGGVAEAVDFSSGHTETTIGSSMAKGGGFWGEYLNWIGLHNG